MGVSGLLQVAAFIQMPPRSLQQGRQRCRCAEAEAVEGTSTGFPQPSAPQCWNRTPGACSQPMHWGWCLQTPGDISCSTIFIVAGLFAVKC